MVCTLRRTLAVALAVLCVASVVALAADTTVSGIIQHVDPNKGRFTLSEEGKAVELQAPAALLAGLHLGDAVEVKTSGQKATLIYKQAGTQRPNIDNVLLPQQPLGGMRQSE